VFSNVCVLVVDANWTETRVLTLPPPFSSQQPSSSLASGALV